MERWKRRCAVRWWGTSSQMVVWRWRPKFDCDDNAARNWDANARRDISACIDISAYMPLAWHLLIQSDWHEFLWKKMRKFSLIFFSANVFSADWKVSSRKLDVDWHMNDIICHVWNLHCGRSRWHAWSLNWARSAMETIGLIINLRGTNSYVIIGVLQYVPSITVCVYS
jgi:hypothetical protein